MKGVFILKIKSLEIKNLFEHLDKKIFFDDNQNILIGMNGTGKTTILKILNSFLSKEFEYFKSLSFSSITIETTTNNYRILKNQKSNDIIIIDKQAEILLKKDETDELQSEIEQLTFELENISETNIEEENKLEEKILELKEKIDNIKKGEFYSTIAGYKRLLEMNEYKNAIHNNLNLIFINDFFNYQSLPILNLNDIKYNSVSENQTLINNLITAISPITEIEILLETIGKKSLQRFNIQNELSKLEVIIEKEKNLDKKDSLLLEKKILKQKLLNFTYIDLDRFLDTINEFFKLSNKKLSFDISLGEFYISVLNENMDRVYDLKEFSYLSLGEQHLLKIFTNIYFNLNPKKENLILIDSPETLLNSKWQDLFLTELNKMLNDFNVQFIIVTHSEKIKTVSLEGAVIELTNQ